MDAVEEASGRVEGRCFERAFDRLCGLGCHGCHLQARLLVLQLGLASALEALGPLLECASARGDVVFGELSQQLHVNGGFGVCGRSCVWDLWYVCYVVGVVGARVGSF